MPALLAALFAALSSKVALVFTAILAIAGPLISYLLKAFGIGLVSYTGLTVVIDFVVDEMKLYLNSLDPQIYNLMGILNVDVAITILSSAVIVKFTIGGLNSGSITKVSV